MSRRVRRAGRPGLPVTAGVSVPADRRFRRSDASPGRRRRVGQLVRRYARIGVISLAGAAGLVWLTTVLLSARALAVEHIVVRGNQRLAGTELEARLEGLRGQNILRVDFESYRRRVLDSPWVAQATLARVLPSTIRVDITERQPMAVARLGAQLYLVDDTGLIIDEYGPAHADLDLPIVDGLLTVPSKGASVVDAGRLDAVRHLLSAIAADAALADRVSQLDVSNPSDVVVLLDADTARLHVGRESFGPRLRRYIDLSDTLRDRFPDLDAVDLRFSDHVFVRQRGERTLVPREP